MRTCVQCDERPATAATGRAVCVECCAANVIERRERLRKLPRDICQKCKTNKKPDGARVCSDCRIWGKRIVRSCRECGASFTTKNASTFCHRCGYNASKKACPGCGVPIHPHAERCMACNGLHRRSLPGSYVNPRGYIYIKARNHPAATQQGYVLEHRLVMEGVLGRALRSDETVHHINGVTGDNRPENLELWSSTHPAGQRVADLVAWAREILATYADLPLV